MIIRDYGTMVRYTPPIKEASVQIKNRCSAKDGSEAENRPLIVSVEESALSALSARVTGYTLVK